MNKVVKNAAVVAALVLLGSAAFAQTPPPPPAHHGLFSKLFHPKPKPGMMPMHGGMMPTHPGMSPMHPGMMGSHPMMGGHPMMGSHSMMGGQFIGNKNTHVFHMPGDRGAMPSPQNRVYFPSAAAAMAAGYHVAGGSRGMTGHSTMMHH